MSGTTPTYGPDDVLALLTNPVRPDLRADPYPLYAALRKESPVLQISAARWFVTRHADAVSVLRNPSFGSDHRNAIEYEQYLRDQGGPNPLQELMMQEVMVFMDPPDHARIRGLVSKSFSAPVVSRMRDRVKTIANQVIDEHIAHREMDVAQEYAAKIPLAIVCELLGIPPPDQSLMASWSRDLAAVFDAVTSEETLMRAGEAAMNFGTYMLSLIDERREDPADDLLSALITAEEHGKTLSQAELIATSIFLLRAGQETVHNALSAGLVALLKRPAVADRLRDLTVDFPLVVEEILRFEPPVQFTARTALADCNVSGIPIPKGHQVLVTLGGANRDPAVFPDPEDFHPARDPNPHLAFTVGSHYCLGASLARIEMDVALRTLFERIPSIELAGDPVWRETSALRGVDHVLVTW